MKKTAQTRIDETLGYIRTHISVELAQNLRTLVSGNKTIGDEIALGTYSPPFHSPQTVETQRRHALRALLLCQRVYFSTLWPRLMGLVSARFTYNWLPEDWKVQSRNFWGKRSEEDIRAALKMFTATSNNADHLADIALKGQPSTHPIPLTFNRKTFAGNPCVTCYDAVMAWLFKSGLVSLQWLFKWQNANTEEALTQAFGAGTVIWQGPFTAQQTLPPVPRGHIVHIFQNNAAWRGHWMVSTGNGQAAGCNNNDETPPVSRYYCSELTLDKQFLDFGGGTAITIDPTRLPALSCYASQ